MDFPDIPDFLKVANRVPCDPAPAIKVRRRTKPERIDWRLPRSIDAAGLALKAEIEAKRKAKGKARIAKLRAEHGGR